MLIAEQVRGSIDTLLQEISPILSLSPEDVARIRKDIARHRRFAPVKIKDNLSWEEVAALMLDNHRWPGLVIDQGLVRSYPFREYTAHPLGYVGSVSEKILKIQMLPCCRFPVSKSANPDLKNI